MLSQEVHANYGGITVTIKHLNQCELARRWNISSRTLESWRWQGFGPAYLKIGGRVVYTLEAIERFEQERLRQTTSEALSCPEEDIPTLAGGAAC
jgi:hypothetical protein